MQRALDCIEQHIKGEISISLLAQCVGYSVYHFSRLFSRAVGMPVMAYVTWRKLQHALYDLSKGKKVIDTAMEYGFETHAGFTKAFKRCFGYPPSICYLRIDAGESAHVTLETLKIKHFGGKKMHPHILELTPFSVVGYPTRHTMPTVKRTADIPAYWNTIKMDYVQQLSKLHSTFTLSKHFEIGLCYDVNPATGEFTYVLGRGIDNASDLANIQPDMSRVDIVGGLYAIFSTQPVPDYTFTIQETWNEILLHWLPQSEFDFDESRRDFEYYDYRDHGYYFGGDQQMDICIPIRQRKEKTPKYRL